MRRAALLIARAARWLSRRTGRGGGTALPGLVLLRLRPRAVAELSADLEQGSVVISATNGKTTTARMVRSIVDDVGWPTVANTAGSNLLRGVAAALLERDDATRLGLFEVDEAALPSVVEQLEPRVVVLMNLFRDQLDRYGELEALVSRWATMVEGLPPETKLALNADDPAIAALGRGRSDVVYFGLDDAAHDRKQLAHATDSSNCPACDAPLDYDLVTIAHLGRWRCPSCGLARPQPQISIRRVALAGLEGARLELDTPGASVEVKLDLPGLHNAYNAAAALACAHGLGLDPARAASALSSTAAAFGRGEQIDLAGRDLLLLLAKNPAGANENVRTITASPHRYHVLVLLNDRTADGHDVSWIWDVDYGPLIDSSATLTLSGDRAHDLALRFVYEGCDRERLTIVPDVSAALDHILAVTAPGDTVIALPTYTAMLDLRSVLVDRSITHPFWEDQ